MKSSRLIEELAHLISKYGDNTVTIDGMVRVADVSSGSVDGKVYFNLLTRDESTK